MKYIIIGVSLFIICLVLTIRSLWGHAQIGEDHFNNLDDFTGTD